MYKSNHWDCFAIFCSRNGWRFFLAQAPTRIQSLLNNTSFSTSRKIPNKIAYRFFPKRPLNLYLATTVADTYITRTRAADSIYFAITNYKKYYNTSYQPLFIKVGNWAMLKFYKDYSIFSSVRVTIKPTQQYVNRFQIIEKIAWLAYKLEIPSDWRNHPIFLITQLEPTLTQIFQDSFLSQ